VNKPLVQEKMKKAMTDQKNGSTLGALWEHSGMTGEHSGSTGEHWGALWEHSGALWEDWGVLWEHFGSTREHSGSTREHSGMTREHSGSTRASLAQLSTGFIQPFSGRDGQAGRAAKGRNSRRSSLRRSCWRTTGSGQAGTSLVPPRGCWGVLASWQRRGGSIPLCFFAELASSRYGATRAHGPPQQGVVVTVTPRWDG